MFGSAATPRIEAPVWLAALLCLLSSATALADSQTEAAAAPPIYYELTPRDAAQRQSLTRSTNDFRLPSLNTDSNTSARRPGWLRAQLIEVPRENKLGQYNRPRYALGFHSNTMRRWLNDIGVEAQSCLAPIVRLRTSISSDFDVNGTLWVHVRCSFY